MKRLSRVVAFGLAGLVASGQTRAANVATITGWRNPKASDTDLNVPDVNTGTGANTREGFGSYTFDNSERVLNLTLQGSATQNGDATADTFHIRMLGDQAVTLHGKAYLSMPLWLNGKVLFENAGVAGNIANANITATLEVFKKDGANQVPLEPAFRVTSGALNASAAGGAFSVDDRFWWARTPTALAAGDYVVRAMLEVKGDAGKAPDSANGAKVTADFKNSTGNSFLLTGKYDGLVANVSATHADEYNSRDFVRAPAARQAFDVTGKNVKVGQVELGVPYAHTALGTRLNVSNGAVAGDYRRDHALAVASIITASDANTGNAGVAPEATLYSSAINSYARPAQAGDPDDRFRNAVTKVFDDGARIINMSAVLPKEYTRDVTFIEKKVFENPNLTFVQGAGNEGLSAEGQSTLGLPANAFNVLTVGALDNDLTAPVRAAFSSTNGNSNPVKPDIMAPGMNINAALPRTLTVNGAETKFGRALLGDRFNAPEFYETTFGAQIPKPDVGQINGTSFAAPHVTGAVALMHEYAAKKPADQFDARAIDNRIMKAVLLNSANRDVRQLKADGTVGDRWSQKTDTDMGYLRVTRSLDLQLGAGSLDTYRALETFVGGEAKLSDSNTERNVIYDLRQGDKNIAKPLFWDLETVVKTSDSVEGSVDYLLGKLGESAIRATLAWNFDSTREKLPDLFLDFWAEGINEGNKQGWDPTAQNADTRVAGTLTTNQNVALLDFKIPANLAARSFYIHVASLADFNAEYGLAVQVPEPTTLLLLVLAIGVCPRTTRRRH